MKIAFHEAVGAVLSLVAVSGILYAVVTQPGSDLGKVALGVLAGVVTAGNGYFLRAKVQGPEPPIVPHG